MLSSVLVKGELTIHTLLLRFLLPSTHSCYFVYSFKTEYSA
jgi:hypothetical protein